MRERVGIQTSRLREELNKVRDVLQKCIQLFQLRLSTSEAEKSNTSGKVEYKRERLLGIALKIH